jgi:peptidoglycan/xylan/chitin deacetylase (PgdA/CDA1 family)
VGLLPLLTACGHSNNAAPPVAASVPPSAPAPKATTAPIPTTAPQNPALAAWKPSAKQFWNGPEAESHVVALTFDAGSDAKAVSLILQTLAAHQVHATFFLTGKFCEKFPKECRAIADAGMELGNHSFSHPHFTHLNDTEIHSQLTRAEAEITKTCGRGARPLFRFPYGDTNKHVCATVASAGYQPIAWTLDSLDSVGKPKSASFVADRIIRKIKPGYITLMHVSCVGSAQALPRIFTYLDKIGAHVVPVSELLLSQPPPTTAARTASHKELHHG